MANAILSFLLSIVISLGGSVTADNIGQDFATIYSNQDPSVQKKMDMYLFDPGGQLIRDITLEGTKLTTEMLYDIQGGKVSSKVINDSIGYEAWKDFVNNNQANVAGFGKSITSADGYKVDFFVDVDPSNSNYLVLWYSVTDPNGSVISKDYMLNHKSYVLGDLRKTDGESKARQALSISYIDEKGQFHLFRADGSAFAVVDCAALLPEGTNKDFIPIPMGDGTIGQITDATIAGTQIGQIPIAADGSITLPDGTKVYPNSDGTYNIDNRVYSPTYNIGAYDDSALLGLLQQLLTRIDELENKLEFEKEKEEDKELEEKQEEAIEELEEAAAESEDVLSQYTYSSKRWANIFPFCIPWDFVRGVKLLSASPVAPKFTIPFEIPDFGSFKGYKSKIVLNFSDYEKYFKPVRWFTTTFFLISLGFITFKIVKGAA